MWLRKIPLKIKRSVLIAEYFFPINRSSTWSSSWLNSSFEWKIINVQVSINYIPHNPQIWQKITFSLKNVFHCFFLWSNTSEMAEKLFLLDVEVLVLKQFIIFFCSVWQRFPDRFVVCTLYQISNTLYILWCVILWLVTSIEE